MTAAPERRAGDEPAAPALPLDEVMLAMDVVDTLRHERAQIEAALHGEDRQRALIARVKEIYLSQGIEVPDEVVAQGVAALEQDRFKYEPPERTLEVRLAEVWVERGKWAKRALLAAGAAAVLALVISVPFVVDERVQAAALESRRAAIAQQQSTLAEDAAAMTEQVQTLRRELQAARIGAPAPVVASILADAERALDAAEKELAAPWEEGRGPFDATAGEPEQERIDRVFARRRQILAAIGDRLGAVRGQLQAVAHLRGMDAAVERALLPLAGVEVEPEARADLDELTGRVKAAVGAGDAETAQQVLRELEQLVAALAQSYELRIVSRPNEQSGVWRESRTGGRNHYIVVEARGEGGRPVELSITNEETQRTHRVSKFAVRVPEEVYERVKADKLDNGIVDETLFGEKREGARAPSYRFPVSGGFITDW